MNYLFVDIECSNHFPPYGAKVCEFGYVLADEHFNVLEKEVFIMSPGRRRDCRFDQAIPRRDPEFSWAYEESYYFSCPEYPYFYERIKKLMEDPDNMAIGYSFLDDVRDLFDSNRRYRLPQFDYEAHDIQRIIGSHPEFELEKGGLKAAVLHFVKGEDYQSLRAHFSEDDAMLTLLVCKGIAETLGMSLEEVFKSHPFATFRAVESMEKSIEKAKKKREASLAQGIWRRMLTKDEGSLNEPASKGKRYACSSSIRNDLELSRRVSYIFRKNHYLFSNAQNADFMVISDQEEGIKMQEHIKVPHHFNFVLLSDFLKR